MFCSQCGAKVNDIAKFCPCCGSVMIEAIPAEAVHIQQSTSVQQYQQPIQQNAPVQQYQQPVQQNAPVQQYQQPIQTTAPAAPSTGRMLSIAMIVTTAIVYILMLTPLFSISLFTQEIDVTIFNSFGLADKALAILQSFGWVAGEEMAMTALGFLGLFVFISIMLIVELVIGLGLLIAGFLAFPHAGDRFISVNMGFTDVTVFILAFVPFFIDTGDYKDIISVHTSPTMVIAAILCVVCFIIDLIGETYNSKHGYVKQSLFKRKERSHVSANAVPLPKPTEQRQSQGDRSASAQHYEPAVPTPVHEEAAPANEWICQLCGTRNKLISDTCKRCEHKRDE